MADRQTHKKKLRTLDLTVVGLGYRVTPAKMEAIAADAPLAAKLVREPENMHDRNAVAVYLNEKPYTELHFGYLSRTVAAELAPRLDAGMANGGAAWVLSVDMIESEAKLQVKARR